MSTLVTGGAGFIGSSIVDLLVNNGEDVKVYDIAGFTEDIKHHKGNPHVKVIPGDLKDKKKLEKALKNVNIVFHEAANAFAGKALQDPCWDIEINATRTLDLLEVCSKRNIECFIYASTMSVYGSSVQNPIDENHLTQPDNPYGISKLIGEKYVQLFHQIYGLPTVILRYFKVYGPRHSGALTSITKKIIQEKCVTVFGDGTQTLDFINVRDVARANLLASQKKNAIGNILNIGSGVETSINELIDLISNLAGVRDIEKKYVKMGTQFEPLHFVANVEKAKEVLNFSPSITLEEGCKELIEILKKGN